MRRALFAATSLVFSLATLAAGSAGANDTPAPAVPNASARFDRGAIFYREGDYAAALIEFKRAYELSPNWRVLFNIGQSYFQLRDYANALVTLQRFAREGGDRISEEDKMTLDSELPDLAGRVGKATVVSNLAGANISVDNEVVGVTPLYDPLLLNEGWRQVSAAHDGRASVSQRVAIGGGDNVLIHLDFPSPPPTLAPTPAPRRAAANYADRQAPQTPNAVPAVVSFLLAAGGVAIGSIFGVRAMNDKASLDRACTSSGACPASSQADINALMRDGTFSTVGFGVGIAALVGGIAFWTASRAASATSVRLQFAPGFVAGSF